mmetsp:Transcript_22239/g.31142  ORF Transcript_22239/g.31142 Transcript_22239/m.31142 type:complete len:110 (-) Transcript_22239:413-742(-)
MIRAVSSFVVVLAVLFAILHSVRHRLSDSSRSRVTRLLARDAGLEKYEPRKKRRDKRRKTFEQYGKNTARGVRHAILASENGKKKERNSSEKKDVAGDVAGKRKRKKKR